MITAIQPDMQEQVDDIYRYEQIRIAGTISR
jgi:hypothetical protein